VPRVTSTAARPGSSQSQGKPAAAGLDVTDGPTQRIGPPRAAAPGPASSTVLNASTRCGENRGSVSPAGSPTDARSSARRSASHSLTLGSPASGSANSAEVVAEVAHGSPVRSATSAPANACWSATTTSGRNVSTAARTPGAIASASGSR
jgi:hypothetical protein